jgi:hypothetical protein
MKLIIALSAVVMMMSVPSIAAPVGESRGIVGGFLAVLG